MTIAQALKVATQQLKAAESGTARLDAVVLLEHISGKDRSWLIGHPEFELNVRSRILFEKLITRRAKQVPTAYLVGHKEFYGLDFIVTPDVMIPRPETEALVDAALRSGQTSAKLSIFDVGTGCGAIAIAIAKRRPNWQITASDISSKALTVARRNAKKHNVNVDFIKNDLLQGRTLQNQKYDIICANLPYIRKEANMLSPEAEHEPAVAFYGGADGLDIYRRFLEQAPTHLNKNGHIIFEADPRQHQSLQKIAANSGLAYVETSHFVQVFRGSSFI